VILTGLKKTQPKKMPFQTGWSAALSERPWQPGTRFHSRGIRQAARAVEWRTARPQPLALLPSVRRGGLRRVDRRKVPALQAAGSGNAHSDPQGSGQRSHKGSSRPAPHAVDQNRVLTGNSWLPCAGTASADEPCCKQALSDQNEGVGAAAAQRGQQGKLKAGKPLLRKVYI
jgi:hypothetical protein